MKMYSRLLLAFLLFTMVGCGKDVTTTYHPNGQKESEGNLKDNKKDGLWTEWYENGQKDEEGHWKNGEQNGLRTEWYENGQKEAELYYKNDKLVSASVWKPDGEPCPITKIVDGSGIVATYDENGQKWWEGHHKDGQFDGLVTWWHENGQKAVEIHWKNGKLDGLWTHWDKIGKKASEIHYKNDKLVSASVWKPDGKPCPITKIVDGSGILVTWHTNGQKWYEGHWKNGKPDGLQAEWDENGNKTDESHWKNGEEVSREEF